MFVSAWISIQAYKSVHYLLIKTAYEPSCELCIKLIPKYVHKSSIHNSLPGVRKEYVQVSLNNTIFKTPDALDSKFTANACK